MSDRDNDPWPPVDPETAAALRALQDIDLPPLDGKPKPTMTATALAAVLREAAALLRERAGASDPGPWTVVPPEKPGELALIQGADWAVARAGSAAAPYIALMSPALGKVLARWLDAKAANLERVAAGTMLRDHDYGYANAVARAILGETEG